MNHGQMMALTADMPMKTIEINGEPYLERYFAHELADGTQVWYHRFLRNDPERHLHSHPWSAISTILCGKYSEQRKTNYGRNVDVFNYSRGDQNLIGQDTVHRIIEVEKDTWSQLVVDPKRLDRWYFIEENGSKKFMPTSPFEWHKDCKPREAK